MPPPERTNDVDSAIRTFMSSHFPKKTLELAAEELLAKLLAKLLNAVSRGLVEMFHAVRKTGSLPDKWYLQALQKAVEYYFEGELQARVEAEAKRQITLCGTAPDELQAESVKRARADVVQCPVCLETPEQIRRSSGQWVVTECGHLLCSGCARQITSCPICREHVYQRHLRRAYL